MKKDDKDKSRRIAEIMKTALSGLASEMLDEEEFKSLEKKIRKELSSVDVPYTRETLKAFFEGMMLAVFSLKSGGEEPTMLMMAGIEKLIKDKDADIDKIVKESFKSVKKQDEI